MPKSLIAVDAIPACAQDHAPTLPFHPRHLKRQWSPTAAGQSANDNLRSVLGLYFCRRRPPIPHTPSTPPTSPTLNDTLSRHLCLGFGSLCLGFPQLLFLLSYLPLLQSDHLHIICHSCFRKLGAWCTLPTIPLVDIGRLSDIS